MTTKELARAKKFVIATGPSLGTGLIIFRLFPPLPEPYITVVIVAALIMLMFFFAGLFTLLMSHPSSPMYRHRWTPTYLALLTLSLATCVCYVYSLALWTASIGWALVFGILALVAGVGTIRLWRTAQGSGETSPSGEPKKT